VRDQEGHSQRDGDLSYPGRQCEREAPLRNVLDVAISNFAQYSKYAAPF
jgi:hypothetical protein